MKINLWKQVELMGWKANNYDFKLIAGNLSKKPKCTKNRICDFIHAKACELYAAIEKFEVVQRKLEIGSDDGLSDVIYHIVGLGEAEFNLAVNDPTLIEKRYNSGYGSNEGYKESFAYCLHTNF